MKQRFKFGLYPTPSTEKWKKADKAFDKKIADYKKEKMIDLLIADQHRIISCLQDLSWILYSIDLDTDLDKIIAEIEKFVADLDKMIYCFHEGQFLDANEFTGTNEPGVKEDPMIIGDHCINLFQKYKNDNETNHLYINDYKISMIRSLLNCIVLNFEILCTDPEKISLDIEFNSHQLISALIHMLSGLLDKVTDEIDYVNDYSETSNN